MSSSVHSMNGDSPDLHETIPEKPKSPFHNQSNRMVSLMRVRSLSESSRIPNFNTNDVFDDNNTKDPSSSNPNNSSKVNNSFLKRSNTTNERITRKRDVDEMSIDSNDGANEDDNSRMLAEDFNSTNFCLCQPAPKIPRPRNAFILYRQSRHSDIINSNPSITNPEISKIAGKLWSEEPENIKETWRKLAEEEKTKHSEQYPNYRFQPKHKPRKGDHNSKVLTIEQSNCSKCGKKTLQTPTVTLNTSIPTPTSSKSIHQPYQTKVISATSPLRYRAMSYQPNSNEEDGYDHKRRRISPNNQIQIRRPSDNGEVYNYSHRLAQQYIGEPVLTPTSAVRPIFSRIPGNIDHRVYIPIHDVHKIQVNGEKKNSSSSSHQNSPTYTNVQSVQNISNDQNPFRNGQLSATKSNFITQNPSQGHQSHQVHQVQQSPRLNHSDHSIKFKNLGQPNFNQVESEQIIPNNENQANVKDNLKNHTLVQVDQSFTTLRKLDLLKRVAPPLSKTRVSESRISLGCIVDIEIDPTLDNNIIFENLVETFRKIGEFNIKIYGGPKLPNKDFDIKYWHYLEAVMEWHKQMKQIIQFLSCEEEETGEVLLNQDNENDKNDQIDKIDIGRSPRLMKRKVKSSNEVQPLTINRSPNRGRYERHHEGDFKLGSNGSSNSSHEENVETEKNLQNHIDMKSSGTIPVAIVPNMLFHVTEEWASSLECIKTSKLQEHWAWSANLWRGTTGPNFMIYISKENLPGTNAKFMNNSDHDIQMFPDQGIMLVKCYQSSLQPATIRRISFEISEWIRSSN